jgi:hypothetical protein
LSSRTYKEQAIWFLNAFWHKINDSERELIWSYKLKMVELDIQKGEGGFELDEMMAHRFLETFKETLTVREMRDKLREVGVEKVRYVPLAHYLIFRFNIDWHYFVNASQGDNQEEVAQAQRLLDQVSQALVVVQKTAEASRVAEAESKVAAAAAKTAQQELEAALAELKAQEDAYNNKKLELERKSEEGGIVSKNKAKAELAQHLAEDPLPLRRAKITTEAAVKKAERTAQAAAQAVSAAAAARVAAENSLEEAVIKVQEAEDYLQEVKSKPGSAQGALWWIDRELHEQKKYMPVSRGGISKN